MRVLVAHCVGAARSGGMSRLMGRTHDELAAAGYEVRYLTADDVRGPTWGGLGRWSFPLLVRRTAVGAARQGRPFDIINVHEPHGAVVARMRRGLGGASVVVTTHGVERRGWEVALAHAPSRPRLRTRLTHPLTTLAMSRVALAGADHIICLNEQDRAYLQHRFAIPPDRVTRLVPGADARFGAAAASRDYGRARHLLFAGTWIPRKGISELAAAFSALLARGSELTLTVIGGGVPAASVLQTFPRDAALHVRVRTDTSEYAIASAMAEADVFVLPSLFEGTPLTLIEAMWSGLPVVTTATAGMQDVVEHGRTGWLVPPGDSEALADAIEALRQSEHMRRTLGTAAYRRASTEYTWRNAAATFDSAYRAARGCHA
jgi:glycosyltransferase involved in cell wall biosynthesis